jgi:hypothetical protein
MLALGSLKQNNVERAEALSGRLEEILIFEISKDGYVLAIDACILCSQSVNFRRLMLCARYFQFF